MPRISFKAALLMTTVPAEANEIELEVDYTILPKSPKRDTYTVLLHNLYVSGLAHTGRCVADWNLLSIAQRDGIYEAIKAKELLS